MKTHNREETGTYTKQSFSEARQKIKPEVFRVLNDTIIDAYYSEEGYKQYKGYRLLAIDGSKIQLPNNKKTREAYGFIRNNVEKFEIAQGLTSTLYDVLNGIVISAILGRCDDSERKLAERNIDQILDSDMENLTLFDRGYASFELIKYLEDRSQKYLMRVKSNFFKEVIGTKTADEIVCVEVTPSRKKHMKQQGFEIETGSKLTMRVIKFYLSSGEQEILITNLDAANVSFGECKNLYFKRWGIETNYDTLKNKFEIENFSGDSLKVIEQDFLATIFIANIASIISEDAQEQYESADNAQKNIHIE